MKTLNIFAAAAAISTAALLAAGPAQASAGYDQYRRVVLGDTTISAPVAASTTRVQLVPGSYAQYLISNGTSKSEAIATAARNGESASYRAVAVSAPQPKLTPAQAYAKYLGNDDYGVRANTSTGSAE